MINKRTHPPVLQVGLRKLVSTGLPNKRAANQLDCEGKIPPHSKDLCGKALHREWSSQYRAWQIVERSRESCSCQNFSGCARPLVFKGLASQRNQLLALTGSSLLQFLKRTLTCETFNLWASSQGLDCDGESAWWAMSHPSRANCLRLTSCRSAHMLRRFQLF